MSFTVIWTRRAQDRLADVWTNAADRAAVTAAADWIDAALAADPVGAGESRVGPYRVLADGPLSVLFRADSVRRTVYVFSVAASARA